MSLEKIKTFSIEEVEKMIKEDVLSTKCQHGDKNYDHSIVVDGYDVYTTSLRYKTFIEKGYKCVCCGRTGAYYVLEKSHGSNLRRAHFNLYSDDGVLMTKDHILPKSKGGADRIENMQTMCTICNVNKGNSVPDGYVPLPIQRKHKVDRKCYFWCGSKKFSSLEKAALGIVGGNKNRVAKAKAKIRDSVENGTPYFGEIWKYGKEA